MLANLFVFLFLSSLTAWFVFVLNPQPFTKRFKLSRSKPKSHLVFLGLITSTFLLIGIFAKPVENLQRDNEPVEVEKAGNVENSQAEKNLELQEPNEPAPMSESPKSTPDKQQVRVTYVIDGDTIEIEGGQRLRYIGIDTPETKDPNRPVACYGQEAYQKNKELVEGKTIELEKDVSETDKYGRLLRYVYVDGQMVNELLVKEGYAKVSSYPPDIKYQDLFREAEKKARENNLGFWGTVCDNWTTPTPTPKTTTKPVSNSGSGCKYDCNGPDRDCSDFATHAEAQAFFDCCGFTISYDPMRLDSVKEGDGVACEGLP